MVAIALAALLAAAPMQTPPQTPLPAAQAAPEQVCKMVQDWFTAQLSIEDKDVQLRLLIESLKPVVAG